MSEQRFTVRPAGGEFAVFDTERQADVEGSRYSDRARAEQVVEAMNAPHVAGSGTCRRCGRPLHDGLTCSEERARLPRRHVGSGQAHVPDASDLPQEMADAYCRGNDPTFDREAQDAWAGER